MSQNKIKNLIEKYPSLFKKDSSIECPEGWANLIDNLAFLADEKIRQMPVEVRDSLYFVQIKQKFGGLRCYFSHSVPYIEGLIAMSEQISSHTCEGCSKPGAMRSIKGWLQTLCGDCFDELVHYKE